MKKIIAISIVLILSFKLNAQIFDTYNENIIKSYVFQLLNRYNHLADFTEDGVVFSADYKNAFEKMFVDTKSRNIYNDLQTKGNYVSPMEYSQMAKEKFPHGMEARIDSSSIKVLQAKLLNGNKYSVEVIADKNLVGITNENKIHRKKTVIHFIVQFQYFDEDEEFDNFLIISITNEETLLKRKSDKEMQGFHIGVGIMPGISNFRLSGNTDGYNRQTQFPISFSLVLNGQYFFNSNFGVSLGVA